jgi:hypothetical protein
MQRAASAGQRSVDRRTEAPKRQSDDEAQGSFRGRRFFPLDGVSPAFHITAPS